MVIVSTNLLNNITIHYQTNLILKYINKIINLNIKNT